MNYKKWIGISSTLLLMVITTTKYQNCAQAPAPDANLGDTATEVRIVDRWTQNKVSFVEGNTVELHNQSEAVNFNGLCAYTKEQSQVIWNVQVGKDDLATGQTECYGGGFQLQLDNLQSLECGQTYHIVAQDPEGESDMISMQRKCAPLSSEQIYLQGDEMCFLELEAPTAGVNNLCFEACYVSNKLVHRMEVTASSCEGMQAQAQ